MTPAQRLRQGRDYRDNGKYAKVNPCYRCGKSAGVDYFSFNADTEDSLGNQWNDRALCVCEGCAVHMGTMSAEAAWAEANSEEWGRLPQGNSYAR